VLAFKNTNDYFQKKLTKYFKKRYFTHSAAQRDLNLLTITSRTALTSISPKPDTSPEKARSTLSSLTNEKDVSGASPRPSCLSPLTSTSPKPDTSPEKGRSTLSSLSNDKASPQMQISPENDSLKMKTPFCPTPLMLKSPHSEKASAGLSSYISKYDFPDIRNLDENGLPKNPMFNF